MAVNPVDECNYHQDCCLALVITLPVFVAQYLMNNENLKKNSKICSSSIVE